MPLLVKRKLIINTYNLRQLPFCSLDQPGIVLICMNNTYCINRVETSLSLRDSFSQLSQSLIMTKTIVDELPEFYKGVLQSQKHEAPTSIYYNELKRNEELRERTRNHSRLYSLFQEDMFGFLTSKGELNLTVLMDNLYSFLQDIEREIDLSVFISDIFDAKKSDYSPTPVPMGERNGKELWLTPKFAMESMKIREDIKDMRDAVEDIYKLGQRAYKKSRMSMMTDGFDYQVYFDRELRDLVKALNTLMSKITRRKLELHNQQYIGLSVKPKMVDQLVKSINWRAVFMKK